MFRNVCFHRLNFFSFCVFTGPLTEFRPGINPWRWVRGGSPPRPWGFSGMAQSATVHLALVFRAYRLFRIGAKHIDHVIDMICYFVQLSGNVYVSHVIVFISQLFCFSLRHICFISIYSVAVWNINLYKSVHFAIHSSGCAPALDLASIECPLSMSGHSVSGHSMRGHSRSGH